MEQKPSLITVNLVLLGLSLLICACGKEDKDQMLASIKCSPGQTQQCPCADGTTSYQACDYSTLTFRVCQCSAVVPTAGASAQEDTSAVGGAMTAAVSGGGGRTTAGTGGRTTGAAGSATTGASGKGGSNAAGTTGASGKGGGSAGAGAAGNSNSADPYNAERQVCVDTINSYRATESLNPLNRAAPEVEACSDLGAKEDGDSGIAHGSARNGWQEFPGCSQYKSWLTGPLKGGQDACPGWPVGGGWGGYATLGDALKGCLKAMWDEKTGFVASGKTREQCQADQSPGGCFLSYGHYLNMSSTGYTTVSCGFYKMTSGAYWMNQDF